MNTKAMRSSPDASGLSRQSSCSRPSHWYRSRRSSRHFRSNRSRRRTCPRGRSGWHWERWCCRRSRCRCSLVRFLPSRCWASGWCPVRRRPRWPVPWGRASRCSRPSRCQCRLGRRRSHAAAACRCPWRAAVRSGPGRRRSRRKRRPALRPPSRWRPGCGVVGALSGARGRPPAPALLPAPGGPAAVPAGQRRPASDAAGPPRLRAADAAGAARCSRPC